MADRKEYFRKRYLARKAGEWTPMKRGRRVGFRMKPTPEQIDYEIRLAVAIEIFLSFTVHGHRIRG